MLVIKIVFNLYFSGIRDLNVLLLLCRQQDFNWGWGRLMIFVFEKCDGRPAGLAHILQNFLEAHTM
jgi:hypothetical protein